MDEHQQWYPKEPMPPEARAKDVCRRAGWTIEPWVYDIIVSAIKDAVFAERERCAKLCEELTDRRVAEMGLTQEGAAHLTGYQCAAAIRAQH